MRKFLASLALALVAGTLVAGTLAAGPGSAACAGRDLIAGMPPEAREAFEARLAAVPHAQGLVWRATRGPAVVHLVGTYHLDDPRHAGLMERIAPLVAGAATVLVEATPDDEAALRAMLAERPELLFITEGPTLPDLLPAAEWEALMAALRARGLPVVIGAKSRPWFVATQLALPPCLAREMTAGKRGLDRRIIELAAAKGIPVAGLEPPDTLLRLFEALPEGGDLALIRTALAMEQAAEDLSATLIEAYFAERPWAIWELSKDLAASVPGVDPTDMARLIALTEAEILVARNRAWIAPILAAAERGPVLAAFGALHLPGEEGVLALLEDEGFRVERLR